MKRVGIIGENPENDSKPVKILLEKEYAEKDVHFFVMLKKFRGSQLDGKNGRPSQKAIRVLRQEFRVEKPQFVIYIRDLDGLPSEKKKIEVKENWFKLLDKEAANDKGIFLLNIYELEALILADISTFNRLYGVNIAFRKNPMYQSGPKEFLINGTLKSPKRQYQESHAADIFEQLDIEKIKNHQQYNKFIEELNERF